MKIANLATYPARSQVLKEAVKRLAPQIDVLNVVLNEYEDAPAWMAQHGNVNPIIPDEDYKDIGKFVPRPPDGSTVFLVDDDLIYPDDYASRMIDEAHKAGVFTGSGAIGGLHGTHYRKSFLGVRPRDIAIMALRRNFRTGVLRKTWRFWDGLDIPFRVDQIGTGTAILPSHLLPDLEFMQDGKCFADVKLAQWAHQKSIPVIALPRPSSWLIGDDQEDTIYANFTSKMPDHLSREISQFAYKIEGAGRPWIC